MPGGSREMRHRDHRQVRAEHLLFLPANVMKVPFPPAVATTKEQKAQQHNEGNKRNILPDSHDAS